MFERRRTAHSLGQGDSTGSNSNGSNPVENAVEEERTGQLLESNLSEDTEPPNESDSRMRAIATVDSEALGFPGKQLTSIETHTLDLIIAQLRVESGRTSSDKRCKKEQS